MKIARLITALIASLLLIFAAIGTASAAGHSDMTYNTPGMTYN